MMYLILFSGVSLFGLLLLILGVRGKRIDDHPLCRKCKYDLIGTPELPANCPECGAKLSKRKATRSGNRKRRRAMLSVGIVILASSFAICGILGWALAKNFNWYPYKPLWVLRNEAIASPPLTPMNMAQKEILSRLTNDKLSDKQIDQLIEQALSIQADKAIIWDYFWGDLIEATWDEQKIKDDQLHRYLKVATTGETELSVRSKIRKDETVQVVIHIGKNKRAGRSERFYFMADTGILRLGDTKISSGGGSISGSLAVGGGRSIVTRKFDAPLGKHLLTGKVRFRVAPFDLTDPAKLMSNKRKNRDDVIDDVKILDWVETASIQIEIVAPDEPVIELIDDPLLKEAIRNAIVVKPLNFEIARRPDSISLIEFEELPMPVGFKVFLRADGKEWPVLNITAFENNRTTESSFLIQSTEDLPIDATHVDIILRSSVQAAEQRAGLNQIWQGEIVIANQQIKRERDK